MDEVRVILAGATIRICREARGDTAGHDGYLGLG
jgi:hypothetical protein